MNTPHRIAFAVAAAVILILGIAYVSSSKSQNGVITVMGEGKLTVAPESASLIVTKLNIGTDVSTTIDEGEKSINNLIALTSTVGGADSEIQRSFYQITPQTSQYIVANAFSIKTKNVAAINDLVKALYSAGATSVSNVTFTTSNPVKTEADARALAIKDASAKAKEIAKSAGKKLGRLVSISDDNSKANSSVGTSGTTSASLGQIEIVKQINLTYELK